MIMHICFFGASVSEQERHHSTQEITGYVTYFSEILTSESNIFISRVTSGSNTIDDAGIIYAHRVVDLQPDICVIDWATSVKDDCDLISIEYIYSELLSNKIIPLTVIFPRVDREQSKIPISIKLRNFCDNYSLPFFDISQLLSKSEISLILRDSVHTNQEGAKIYAQLLLDQIRSANVEQSIFDIFSSKSKKLFVKKVHPKGKVKNITKKMIINIGSGKSNQQVKFFLEQRVGPWSTFVDVYIPKQGESDQLLKTVPIYDPWCWRERQCLKNITDWISLPAKIVKLCQSDKLPNYGSNAEKCDFEAYPKHIRPKGDLFMLSNSEHIEASVIY